MANQNNGLLSNNSGGANLRDFQHAARMFTDSNQIYGPKQKFLFHVAFHINKGALRNLTLANTYSTQINMLVKSVSLPKFSISTDKINQYNRKKNIQQKINYEDITIKFHDDNLGLINQLWQNYYGYYYADPGSAGISGAYDKTAIRKFNHIRSNYGLDNGSSIPFFDYITIYQMAQGQYVSYKLINPIFSSWSHNNLDYAGGASPHDNDATIQYEAVEYGSGKVQPGDPEGFALQNYDLTPSPLNAKDLTGASPNDVDTTPSLLEINTIPDNKSAIIDNALQSLNNYLNNKSANNSVAAGNGNNFNSIVGSTNTQTPNSNTGVVFPKTTNSTTITNTTPSTLTGTLQTQFATEAQALTPQATVLAAQDAITQLVNWLPNAINSRPLGVFTPGSTSLLTQKYYSEAETSATLYLVDKLTPLSNNNKARQIVLFETAKIAQDINNLFNQLTPEDLPSLPGKTRGTSVPNFYGRLEILQRDLSASITKTFKEFQNGPENLVLAGSSYLD
jgi:hypothetical protein